MIFSRKLGGLLALGGMLVLISAKDAFAYIDAGTGSYILQLVLAGFLGACFAAKAFWKNIKAFFSKLFSKG